MSVAAPSRPGLRRPPRRLRRLRIPAPAVSIALLPVLIAAWFLATESGAVSRILLPPPEAVARAVPRVLQAPGFQRNLVRTVTEILTGYALGSLIGFSLGLLLGSSTRLRRAYLPFLSAFDAIPTIILAPLIITWFGFGLAGKTVQAAIACFYAVFITTLSGLSLADPDAVTLMRSLRASPWQILVKLRIPSALPAIFGGLQIGATLAIIGAIVSEFVAADAGLGFMMVRYRSSFNTAAVFVLILIFLLLGLASYLLLQFAQRKIVFWRHPDLIHPESST
ncbi:MAG TPA: ABC transporter permease [Actinomycetes bacterium]|jgi:NitT/TauT family transport system permease protein|nr:ABC transporter permease [Actinomycetes bacterium]